MKGLDLSRRFYNEIGRPRFEERYPEVMRRSAVGLAGEGSDCFGFDDSVSRDHDWGPGFCLWLGDSDADRYGGELRELYEALDPAPLGHGLRVTTAEAGERVGVLRRTQFFSRYLGRATPPQSNMDWLRIPENCLAVVCNGEVFADPEGEFTAIRTALMRFYPEDVLRKKLAARLAVMAQAGQYNFPRCLSRNDPVAAGLAAARFAEAACSAIHLLHGRYAPFYKWMHRSVSELSAMGRSAAEALRRIYDSRNQHAAMEAVTRVCAEVARETENRKLGSAPDPFLEDLAKSVQAGIRDPAVAGLHLLVG